MRLIKDLRLTLSSRSRYVRASQRSRAGKKSDLANPRWFTAITAKQFRLEVHDRNCIRCSVRADSLLWIEADFLYDYGVSART